MSTLVRKLLCFLLIGFSIAPAFAQDLSVAMLGSKGTKLPSSVTSGHSITNSVTSTASPSALTYQKIEAEDWRTMSGVQNEPTSDEGGGQNVGYIDHGDYMDYSINLEPGYYRIDFRVATPNPNARFNFNIDGVDYYPNLFVEAPQTGSWQSWKTVSQHVYIEGNRQRFRIISDGGGGFNINWLQFTRTNFIGYPYHQIPGRWEAEHYLWAFGAQIEPTTDEGGGHNVGWLDPGSMIEFQYSRVNIVGSYEVTFRVSSPHDNVKINVVNYYGPPEAVVVIPNTGGWQNWTSVTVPMYMDEYPKDLRFYIEGGSVNINWVDFKLVPTTYAKAAPRPALSENSKAAVIYPNPTSDHVNIQIDNAYSGRFKVQVVNSIGVVLKEFPYNKPTGGFQAGLSLKDLRSGNYFLVIQGEDWREVRSVIKR
jgi:hypothetical protein